MGLKALVDDLEEIEESARGFYTRDGDEGPYRLDVEPVGSFALEDVGSLKSVVGKEKEQRRKAVKRAEEASGELTSLQTKLQELEDQIESNAKVDVDQIVAKKLERQRKDLVKDIEAERDKLRGELESEREFSDRTLVDDQFIRLILAEGGEPELLMPIAKKLSKVDRGENGSGRRVLILDEFNEPRMKGSEFMEPKDLVAEMKAHPKFGRAFSGSGASGSGAPASTAKGAPGGAGMPRHRGDFRDDSAKAAWIGANGVKTFLSLPPAPAAQKPGPVTVGG